MTDGAKPGDRLPGGPTSSGVQDEEHMKQAFSQNFRRSLCEPEALREYVASNPDQNIELVTGQAAQDMYREYFE